MTPVFHVPPIASSFRTEQEVGGRITLSASASQDQVIGPLQFVKISDIRSTDYLRYLSCMHPIF